MVGLYVVGILIVLGIVALIYFRVKWSRAETQKFRKASERIQKENAEAATKPETGGSN